MAAEMAMLNVRLNRALKEDGDAFLREMGVPVSELVRALWQKLAGDKAEARQQVESIMARQSSAVRQEEADRKVALVNSIDEGWQQFAGLVGLDLSTFVPMTDEEIGEARYEHLLEKYGD